MASMFAVWRICRMPAKPPKPPAWAGFDCRAMLCSRLSSVVFAEARAADEAPSGAGALAGEIVVLAKGDLDGRPASLNSSGFGAEDLLDSVMEIGWGFEGIDATCTVWSGTAISGA